MTPGRCLGIAACGLVLALGGTPAEAQDAVDQLTLVIDGPPPPQAPEVMSRDAAGRATVRATRLTAPLDIDGTLDEDVYEHVPAISGFIQQEPDEGAAATERTEAWVFYDEAHVYVTARLWDSAPEAQWIANDMRRDSFQIINNDTFQVALDTFYDRRNGVAFMVNPIGGFFDYEISDEGNPNSDWNPVWDMQTGRFDGGWTIEMQIPFKSLRYGPGVTQVWGIQLGRRVRRKNESAYLTPIPISARPGIVRLSAAGTLVGVEAPQRSTRFEIKPYGIASSATDVTADRPPQPCTPCRHSSASASSMPPPGTRALSARPTSCRSPPPPSPTASACWKPISAPRCSTAATAGSASPIAVASTTPTSSASSATSGPPPHASAAGTGRVPDRPPGLTGDPPLGIIKLCQVGSGDIAMPPLPPRKGAHLGHQRVDRRAVAVPQRASTSRVLCLISAQSPAGQRRLDIDSPRHDL